jgi:uncharacterized protein (TIGR03086 family)
MTIAVTSSVAPLARALDQAGAVIAGVRPDQATLPTPCRSWDVRHLVNHVVDEVRRFAEIASGGTRGPSEGWVIGADPVRDGWAGAYQAAAESLRAAWRQPGALDRVHRLPGGELPATWALGQQLTELVIHAWDIAKATGQSTDLDPELGRLALDWGQANLVAEFRGDEADGYHVGPEIRVPADAPLYDRIAAFGGRDPQVG